MPYITAEGGRAAAAGLFRRLLGRGSDPLFVLARSQCAGFRHAGAFAAADMTAERLESRHGLSQQFDELGRSGERRLQDMDGFQVRAW